MVLNTSVVGRVAPSSNQRLSIQASRTYSCGSKGAYYSANANEAPVAGCEITYPFFIEGSATARIFHTMTWFKALTAEDSTYDISNPPSFGGLYFDYEDNTEEHTFTTVGIEGGEPTGVLTSEALVQQFQGYVKHNNEGHR